jgi:hypothetical protein
MSDRQHREWRFPLPRTHTGALQGNGVLGVMVWGEGRVLRVTLGRADFWDRRGGTPFTPAMSFANIRRLLEAGDEPGIRAAFKSAGGREGVPERPTLLPIGRLELHLPNGHALQSATLDYADGSITVKAADPHGAVRHLRLVLAVDRPVLSIDTGELNVELTFVPAWEYPKVRDTLSAVGYHEPTIFARGEVSGFIINTPTDGSACLAALQTDAGLLVTVELDRDEAASLQAAERRLLETQHSGRVALVDAARKWWQQYWIDVPTVRIPDPTIDDLYHYGIYKFAGLTHPDGVAAGLQGPWIEEYWTPPWSGDYHFNINVQMCYSPAYAGNRLSHLRPLFELIGSWMPRLREYAKTFVGIDDGIMLPHAVDDRCTIIGSFWTGTIDHACTAWVAKMMFDCWRFGGADEAFLRDTAMPFMRGAMRVFEQMIETAPDGSMRLPVSVSPEYRGAAMNAWGENASFQLAAIHNLIENLQAACEVLRVEPDPKWAEIQDVLPDATVEPRPENGRLAISLWKGTQLEESHRHHSHLGAITPFETIDPHDETWREIVKESIRQWTFRGMGMWSGWCMPWASQIHTRLNNADMAVLIIEIWRRVFTNEGGGTLHDCNFPGLTLLGARDPGVPPEHEIMQMDAGMGITTAILDLLCHDRRGVVHLFAGCPAEWRDVSFDGIRVPGGFLLSASRVAGRAAEVRALATSRAGTLRIRNPFVAATALPEGVRLVGNELHLSLNPGESIAITA